MAKADADRLITTGTWGDTTWELYQSPRVPNVAPELITAAGCVAIRRLYVREVVLTLNPGRRLDDDTIKTPKFEILYGHLDPIDRLRPHGSKEAPEQTARREALEEGGFIVSTLRPIAYYKAHNPPGTEYPETSYGIIYRALTDSELAEPTDPKKPVRGSFFPCDLDGLVRDGLMDPVERTIVGLGITEVYVHGS